MKKLIAMACLMLAASPMTFAQDQAKDEAKKSAPAAAPAPKADAPKADAPKADASKADASKAEKAKKDGCRCPFFRVPNGQSRMIQWNGRLENILEGTGVLPRDEISLLGQRHGLQNREFRGHVHVPLFGFT